MRLTIYALMAAFTITLTTPHAQASGLDDPVVTPEVIAEDIEETQEPNLGWLVWLVTTIAVLGGSGSI